MLKTSQQEIIIYVQRIPNKIGHCINLSQKKTILSVTMNQYTSKKLTPISHFPKGLVKLTKQELWVSKYVNNIQDLQCIIHLPLNDNGPLNCRGEKNHP